MWWVTYFNIINASILLLLLLLLQQPASSQQPAASSQQPAASSQQPGFFFQLMKLFTLGGIKKDGATARRGSMAWRLVSIWIRNSKIEFGNASGTPPTHFHVQSKIDVESERRVFRYCFFDLASAMLCCIFDISFSIQNALSRLVSTRRPGGMADVFGVWGICCPETIW